MLDEVTFTFIPNSNSPWNTEISLDEARTDAVEEKLLVQPSGFQLGIPDGYKG